MTRNQLIKKINFSSRDFDAIEDAVKSVEKKTQGEIAVAVTAESSHYAVWELLAALGSALVMYFCLLPMSSQILEWMETKFWNVESWYLSAFFIVVSICVTVALYFLYNIPFIDRLVIPAEAKHAAVTNRAMRYFAESGVYITEKNCGVLIFVSYFEREVRIIADKGISEKISDDLWRLIADEMSENISRGDFRDAFLQAIDKCGNLLIENFPVAEGAAEKKDELYNGLVVLEDERWM